MRRVIVFTFTILLAIIFRSYSQQIQVVNYEQLDKIINDTKDSVVVVNFWATWCKPCIEELPYFAEAGMSSKNKPVKFLFVSMDFTSKKDKAEDVFSRSKLPGKVVLLNEDPNIWINKLNPQWGGDIPYTFLQDKKGNRTHYPKTFATSEELINLIKKELIKQ
ncbi:alkyl hydroperoxide reductase [Sporocytophaga myxococcoides]|uniref:Alkyl hydroperoxide reductase n=1 Tax=Sporocytophaga myxococcoides TaxID=153721 RepID=A0A098LJE2_9BACT|nr:TlpA disulfide reductase family protein [Sporocytophaga myxococcoides]GAL86599.1 alkyl hydroperoxide reductase [Sporocytophaga myxococcoides]